MPSAFIPPSWSCRILARLEEAKASEPNPHYQDDHRIAWITVLRAGRGETIPHISASYTVLGLHPEMVWASILARRKALLGPWYERWGWALPPKKPAQSERLPRIARAA